ncbi:MAG: hypothetical protein ACRDD8_15075 [Bacteroidales bacterium]
MKKNVNSFASNTEDISKNINITLETLTALNKSLTTEEDTVPLHLTTINPVTGAEETMDVSIPSFNNIINKMDNNKNTLESILSGNGKVCLEDGTMRNIRVDTLGKTPDKVFGLDTPTTFKSVSNWFFEDLLFPKLVVPFDLKGKIDDNSDRVIVKRVIVQNDDERDVLWFKNNLLGKNLSYTDAINIINNSGRKYFEDEDIVDLPLSVNKYVGKFPINKTAIIGGKLWYFLDNTKYSLNEEGNIVNNIELTIGDKLFFKDTSYIISDMVNSEGRIAVDTIVGFNMPLASTSFEYYCEPFSEKIVHVGVSNNELILLFFKAINDDYNIISNQWSDSLAFYTNDLVLEGSDLHLPEFYHKYVVDYSKQLEGQIKDRYIPAYFGEVPNTPSLKSSDFKVVQINKHINAFLSEQSIINTQKQITETKSQIDSYKSTIAKQKQDLISKTLDTERAAISDSIKSYTNKLDTLTTEYSSLVKSLAALAYENQGVDTKAKYRIRGFFPIPELKQSSDSNISRMQEIVQFEIIYRYLKVDNTSSSLSAFKYTDTDDGVEKTGVFSDWVYAVSKHKERVFDNDSKEFIWVTENVADGEEVNINQIDIPIQKAEKVEIRVRAVSEAGWPNNPLKSAWSNSIVVDFPSNVENASYINDIMSQAKVNEIDIQLQETLKAAGLYVHIDDAVQNSNTANGVSFKHMANNIGIDIPKPNNSITETVPLDKVISMLLGNNGTSLYNTQQNEVSVEIQDKTVTTNLQKLLSVIIKKLNITEYDLKN